MYIAGDTIDGKYLVEGLCSNSGGMGTILFVLPLVPVHPFRLVLKFCKETAEENVLRFKRETRLLGAFAGNSKVAQLIDSNLDHEPPYFVMKFYEKGDLVQQGPAYRATPVLLESAILQMIAAIHELHARDQFHRDIKLQNFLLDGDTIVVSDFGLITEVGSATAFTRSSMYWGTQGYLPPEFLLGGFKHADAMSDIFMLGKAVYALATGHDPTYLLPREVPAPLFRVIQRSCSMDKDARYQSLADLAQSVVSAFDVILGRGGGVGKVRQLLSSVLDRLVREGTFLPEETAQFIEELALVDEEDKIRICSELTEQFFRAVGQDPVVAHLPAFLDTYAEFVESQSYSWAYAETIANFMAIIFRTATVPNAAKVKALDLAIRAAKYTNRFAAMDTCRALVAAVSDPALGLEVAALLSEWAGSFATDMEPSQCHNQAIAAAIEAANR
jgi:serine/threonine protein kinase